MRGRNREPSPRLAAPALLLAWLLCFLPFSLGVFPMGSLSQLPIPGASSALSRLAPPGMLPPGMSPTPLQQGGQMQPQQPSLLPSGGIGAGVWTTTAESWIKGPFMGAYWGQGAVQPLVYTPSSPTTPDPPFPNPVDTIPVQLSSVVAQTGGSSGGVTPIGSPSPVQTATAALKDTVRQGFEPYVVEVPSPPPLPRGLPPPAVQNSPYPATHDMFQPDSWPALVQTRQALHPQGSRTSTQSKRLPLV